ncbi:SLATT domain-containing protein [Streptomyces albiflavescens]|nr:SLATT domain-containing protein [Streptomyces albiflavescens]
MRALGRRPKPGAAARQTLADWHRNVRIFHVAHERSASSFHKRSRQYGVASLTLSAVVGTAIFATLNESPALTLQILAGLLSVLAAVLAALQSFLGYPQLTEQHRQAVLEYGRIRRRMEVALAGDPELITSELLSAFATELDTLRLTAPSLSQRVHDRAVQDVDGAEGRPRTLAAGA